MTSTLTPAQRRAFRAKQARQRYALFAVGGVFAVAFSMAWNPPIASQHSFTSASDYKISNESGCTNSGSGCHGEETSYKDFNAYHPNAGCTDCHEYQGVGCIPCHAPREHECALCHDGSMRGASDCVRLSDPYPNGHYRETSHTVDVPQMKRSVGIDGAQASATCRDCHSTDLLSAHRAVPTVDGSPYGTDVGCGECHNDVRAGGQAAVIADWPVRTCESCHTIDSSSPMHPVDDLTAVDAQDAGTCGDTGVGCHESNDLHALHADAPKDCSGSAASGEPGCHDLDAESGVAIVRSCGGTDESCHKAGASGSYLHKNMDAHRATDADIADTSVYGVACSSCHTVTRDGSSLLQEHGTTATARPASAACRGCHNASASQDAIATQDSSCAACHSGPEFHDAGLDALHEAQNSTGCAASGIGCHVSGNLLAVGATPGALHSDCMVCHEPSVFDGSATSCGSQRACHGSTGEFDPKTGIHTIGGAKVGGFDLVFHDAGSQQRAAVYTDAATGLSISCGSCHVTTLASEHTRPNVATSTASICVRCHNAGPRTAATVQQDWPARNTAGACVQCHAGSDGADAPHGSITTAHAATEIGRDGTVGPGGCVRAGCHATNDVRLVHADKGCTLSGCHTTTGDIRGADVMTCGGADGTQAACHTESQRHLTKDAKHQATEYNSSDVPTPGSCVRAGCHATVDVRTLHETNHCSNPGCHVEGGPTEMGCGGSDANGAACHTASKRHLNKDAKHQATELNTSGVATPGSCVRAGCHATTDVRTLHKTNHCSNPGCHVEGGPTNMRCGGADGTAGTCHTASQRHATRDQKHQATEYDASGAASPGTCVTAGCHGSVDVRTIHPTTRCSTPGCHVEGGPLTVSCGGAESDSRCHVSYSATQHFQSHSATLVGTVGTTTYGPGENEGCLDSCHDGDLVSEHAAHMATMEGGAATVCRVCHFSSTSTGNGTYASATAVKAAIASGDRRCVSCHSSGSSLDTGSAVASPQSTCVPSAGSAASLEPVTTAQIVDSIRSLTETPETMGTRASSFARQVPTPRSHTTEPSAETSSDAATDTKGSSPATDSASGPVGTPVDPEADDPAQESSEQPSEEQLQPTDGNSADCPAQGSAIETAPDLEKASIDEDVCLMCHELVTADSVNAADTQEEKR